MKVKFLFIIFSFHVLRLVAQDPIKIDSLQIKLNNTNEDTSKVKILLELSDLYSRTDFLKALEHAKEALKVSNHLESRLYLIRSHIKIGNILIFIGNYDEALNNFLVSLTISKNDDFLSEELVALASIGIVNDRVGKFDDALKYYFEALNIYNKCIENRKPLSGIKSIHGLYNNIGNIYLSKNQESTAENYYLKGLAIAEQKKDYINIGNICNNLGKIEIQRKNYPQANKYLSKSLDARTKVNDKSGIAKSYYYLSNYYIETNNLDEAQKCAEKALDLGTNLKEPLTRQIASMFLYQINKGRKKFDVALKYHEQYKQISDSLINDNKIQEFTRLQLQYDYEKIEKEKAAKQQIIRLTYIIISSTFFLGMIILGLLFFLTRSRNKRIKLENEKLEKDMIIKNKELTANVIYLLKKNELIDSITARLLKLKEKLKDENLDPLQKIIIDLQSLTEKEVWDEFEVRFQSVHEEFYQNLKKNFPDLTPSEIKLAAFLRLNMTSKEISALTGQSINSLETARYRLRKKLGITNQEVNLVNFLLNI